jgi:Ring finger domain
VTEMSANGLVDDPICAVCLDQFKLGERIIQLAKCVHFFHRDCITPWFARSDTCPMCRGKVTPDEPMVTDNDVDMFDFEF